MKRNLLIAVAAAAVTAVGCGSSVVPADKLARSQAAIRSASEMGAEKNPNAALHLKLANEQLALGRKLIVEGDNARAEYVLMRAEADADVALNLAREAQARMEAQKTIEQVRLIRTSQPEGM